jgi:hypothetical protein
VNFPCFVSLGELLDKIAILELKQQHIKDPAKLRIIERELPYLRGLIKGLDLSPCSALIEELRLANHQMWRINDLKRAKARRNEFDSEFVAVSVEEDVWNDRRHNIKDTLNLLFDSMRELKSYHE